MAIPPVDRKEPTAHPDLIRPLQRLPTFGLHDTLAKAIANPAPVQAEETNCFAIIVGFFSSAWTKLCEWVYWLLDIKKPVELQDLPPDPLKSIAGYLDYNSVVQLKRTSRFFAKPWTSLLEWERKTETVDHANYRRWIKRLDIWKRVAFPVFRMQVISSGKWLKNLELILTELDVKRLKQLFPTREQEPQARYPSLQKLVLKTDSRDLEDAAIQPDSLDEALADIGFHCPKLQTLSTSLLSTAEVVMLVDNCTQLSVLKIASLCSDWNWKEFAQCLTRHKSHLQEMHLGKGITVSGENILAVSAIEQLRNVAITDPKARDSEIAYFTKHPSLQEVRLSIGAISRKGVETLVALANLTTLELEDCSKIAGKEIEFLVKNATKLTRLILKHSRNIDDILQDLDEAPALTRLRIHDCTQLTDEGLKALARCEKLSYLKIYNTRENRSQITDVGLRHLTFCRSLQQLKLAREYGKHQSKDKSWNHLTADGIKHLVKERPSLRHLTVSLGHLMPEERSQLKQDLLTLRPDLELT